MHEEVLGTFNVPVPYFLHKSASTHLPADEGTEQAPLLSPPTLLGRAFC